MSEPGVDKAPASSAGEPPRIDDSQRMLYALIVAAILAMGFVAAGLLLPPRAASSITAPAPTPIDYVPYASPGN